MYLRISLLEREYCVLLSKKLTSLLRNLTGFFKTLINIKPIGGLGKSAFGDSTIFCLYYQNGGVCLVVVQGVGFEPTNLWRIGS